MWIIGAAEGRHGARPAGAPAEAVVQDYLRFERSVKARNRAEMIALGLIVAGSAAILLRFNPPMAPIAWPFLAVFAAILAFLALRGWAAPIPAGADLEPLRNHFSRELARQNGLRGFMWWFWFGPLFVGLVANLILFGIRMEQPLRIAIGAAALLLLAGFIAKANRDRGRAVRDRIAALSASGEAAAAGGSVHQIFAPITQPRPFHSRMAVARKWADAALRAYLQHAVPLPRRDEAGGGKGGGS